MTLPLFPAQPTAPRAVSLVRLAGEIARQVAAVGRFAVEGEVHRPTKFSSGRVYFVLRDRAAQITVTCPSGRSARCRTVAGERVCVVGSLSWSNERGQLQLIADEVTPVGDGAVAAMVAETRRRLLADGLLDRPRRPIPRLPDVIGVLCGSEAAVRKDIESVVAARFPGYPMLVAETTVSGPGAAGSIVATLERLAAEPGVEVVILARGGGDSTQLLPWSDEELCRAVCDCPVAVVSAIGHDGDRPLCDEVADLRCGTPSLAAAAIIPDRALLLAELAACRDRGRAAAAVRLDRACRRLETVDTARSVTTGLDLAGSRLVRLGDQLHLLHPRRQVAEAARRLVSIDGSVPARRRLEQARARLDAADWRTPERTYREAATARLAADRRQLDALSPARVLDRGYAVVRVRRDGVGRGDGVLQQGDVVRAASQVSAGQLVDVQLAAGSLVAAVEEVRS